MSIDGKWHLGPNLAIALLPFAVNHYNGNMEKQFKPTVTTSASQLVIMVKQRQVCVYITYRVVLLYSYRVVYSHLTVTMVYLMLDDQVTYFINMYSQVTRCLDGFKQFK